MPTDDENAARPLPAATHERLARIAELLGCAVEDFMDGGQALREQRGASELLKLWGEIRNTDDRRRLLDFARELAKA